MLVFTKTEQRIIEVLADGHRHLRKEIHAVLPDELGPLSNIQPHIVNLRKKLERRGETIICELYNNNLYYRHVRLVGTGPIRYNDHLEKEDSQK